MKISDMPELHINDYILSCSQDGTMGLVTPTGEHLDGVHIVRAFPFTAADGPVAVVDSYGNEIIWIDDLGLLSLEHQRFIKSLLETEEFLPRIHSIESVSRGTPYRWNVVTDRGDTFFEQATSDGVAWHTDGSVTISDCDGICYLIPTVQHLDRRSRRLLERHS
jgi:hypothetical protein